MFKDKIMLEANIRQVSMQSRSGFLVITGLFVIVWLQQQSVIKQATKFLLVKNL